MPSTPRSRVQNASSTRTRTSVKDRISSIPNYFLSLLTRSGASSTLGLENTTPPAESVSYDLAITVLVELADEILDHLDILWVHYLSQTNRLLRRHGHAYLLRRVQSSILPWFENPKDFRDILRQTRSVVSGSKVLNIALATDWQANDVDIYVPRGMTGPVVEYLKSREGYTIVYEREVKSEQATGYDGLRSITQLVKLLDRPQDETRANESHSSTDSTEQNHSRAAITAFDIASSASFQSSDSPTPSEHLPSTNSHRCKFVDVLESRSSAAIEPIFRFAATYGMNYLTADQLVISYPLLTFNRLGIGRNSEGTKQHAWRQKYSARGFSIIKRGEWAYPAPCGAACRAIIRLAGDKKCMQIQYGEERAKVKKVAWSIRGRPGSRPCVNHLCQNYGYSLYGWEITRMEKYDGGRYMTLFRALLEREEEMDE